MKKVILLLFVLIVLYFLSFSHIILAQTPSASPFVSNDDLDDYHTTSIFPLGYVTGLDTKLAPQLIQEQKLFTQLDPASLPNIVFIITDDQPPGLLGLAGNSLIKTPNIDSLADKGIYFSNMYLPHGICEPSRASIWTGKLPHNHGVTSNGIILPPTEITLPEILKANGYSTGLFGKCVLGNPLDPGEYRRGFDQITAVFYPNGYPLADWRNYQVWNNGFMETHTEYVTDFLTNESIKYITNQAINHKPFFLWLAHVAPHQAITLPDKDLYQLDQMPQPYSISDDLSTKPPQQLDSDAHKMFTWSGAQQELHNAYESVSNIDDNVGKIISTLNQLGVRDNTIIIYMSDNGLFYGEHQLMRKGAFFYDEQIKSPFIISYPKVTSQKRSVNTLAESIDILPTILDLLKIPDPVGIQGRSFGEILRGGSSNYRRSAFLEYEGTYNYFDFTIHPTPVRGIIMDGYKWIHYMAYSSTYNGVTYTYDAQNHELYNLNTDPYEMINLLQRLGPEDNPLARMINDPTYGTVIRKLRKEVAVWQTDTGDDLYRRRLSNFIVNKPSNNSVQISWQTDYASTSEIEYRELTCQTCLPQELNDFNVTTNHSVIIPNLKTATYYNVRIYSIGPNGNGGYQDLMITTGLQGDFNSDSRVDILDLRSLLSQFTSIFDYNLIVGSFGK